MPKTQDYKNIYLHKFNKESLRGRVLHSLHSRPMLIFVCSLVILECLCVMAELMVDLHGIRVRFNREEKELDKLSKTLQSENKNCPTVTHSLGDLVELAIDLHSKNTTVCCNDESTGTGEIRNHVSDRNKRSFKDIIGNNADSKTRPNSEDIHDDMNVKSVINRRSTKADGSTGGPDIFVFSLHIQNGNNFVISTFDELATSALYRLNTTGRNSRVVSYTEEYEKIQTVSHTIKYIGFSILSLMVVETIAKIMCLGFLFFKKKIEVFDAFIVTISFVLDVVFIDSNWYETGKDATSFLVLLLPWRIVRIINSFIMTINHKHQIELMTIKRSRKKVVLKLKKLRHLMLEMRCDIDLLITLSKTNGASDPEIFNCIYGKGRGTKSLTAITSFASLMFISTLGKDPSNKSNCDDMYGELIKDILGDDDDDDDYDTELEKTVTDSSTIKDMFTDFEPENTDDCFIVQEEGNTKKQSFKAASKSKTKITRRVTLPRRHKSCSEDEAAPVCYINDAYDIEEEIHDRRPSLNKIKRDVQSLPQICTSVRGKNYVTFEVSTQVTYL